MPRRAITRKRVQKVGKEVFDIDVEGIKAMQRNIESILNATTGQEIKKVYMQAAMVLVREAKDLVPVRTGRLRDAIFADYGDPQKASVIVGVNYRKAPHAHLVEFGTVRWSGRPYMRPALTATRSPMAATIVEGFQKILKPYE